MVPTQCHYCGGGECYETDYIQEEPIREQNDFQQGLLADSKDIKDRVEAMETQWSGC